MVRFAVDGEEDQLLIQNSEFRIQNWYGFYAEDVPVTEGLYLRRRSFHAAASSLGQDDILEVMESRNVTEGTVGKAQMNN